VLSSGRKIRNIEENVASSQRHLEEVHRSEERFRSLVQNASDIILVLDEEGTILYESPAVERVLGFTPEERVGRRAFDLIHPDDRSRVAGAFRGRCDNPGPFTPVEYRVRHREGDWRHLESTGENLLHDPAIKGIVVNARDVTDRAKA
jgi:PAS domain S-box-containing protein